MSSRTLVGVILFIVVIILLIRVFQPAGAVSPTECVSSIDVDTENKLIRQNLMCRTSTDEGEIVYPWGEAVIPGPDGWTWWVWFWRLPEDNAYETYMPLVTGDPVTFTPFTNK